MPRFGAMIRAILVGESVEDARKTIELLRHVEFHLALPRVGGEWISQMISAGRRLHTLPPQPQLWAASIGKSHVHACQQSQGKIGPLCKWNQAGALAYFNGETLRADTLREAKQWGRSFCAACFAKIRVSLHVQVKER